LREAVILRLADRAWIADALTAANADPDGLDSALVRAEDIAASGTHRSEVECGLPVEAFVHRIDLDEVALTITLDLAPLLARAASGPVLAPAVPMSLRRNGRNRPIFLEANSSVPRWDAELIALVADARRWIDDLMQGRAKTVAEITERKGLRPRAVSRIFPLALLAPDIAAAILEGRQPADLTARRLRKVPELPLDWSEQRGILGFPSA